uniref:Phosphatidylinositol transfer protein beta isoform n=1 Tax=Oncorhynchus mykiss TaxID=8022 RepID=A0A8L0DRJ2_ONCMY
MRTHSQIRVSASVLLPSVISAQPFAGGINNFQPDSLPIPYPRPYSAQPRQGAGHELGRAQGWTLVLHPGARTKGLPGLVVRGRPGLGDYHGSASPCPFAQRAVNISAGPALTDTWARGGFKGPLTNVECRCVGIVCCSDLLVLTVILLFQDYKAEEDPALFKSAKTGRGPLGPNWKKELLSKADCPRMCAYKLVTVKFKWWGLQNKVESFIHKQEKRIFTNFHRQLFCWIDKWVELTMEDIRRMEAETQKELEEMRRKGSVRGTKASDE